MKITIERIRLTNFKCFRDREFKFSPDVTIIRGRNGAGKTTIADAILWCLFGKNSQGQSDFDLKTHGEDGKPIPNLDHSVELELVTSADDDATFVYTLKRTLKETWTKKRGSEEYVFKNNTTEYMVNGEVKTATDYKKFISELVSEDIFRAITNPSYFPSLKWQQQREFLIKLVGDIPKFETVHDDKKGDDYYLIPNDYAPEGVDKERLREFAMELSGHNEDIISYRKHLSYQIRQVKDKLDKIPVRRLEQHKALPDKLDWDALVAMQTELEEKIKQIDERILQIKSGGSDDIKREEIRKVLDEKHQIERQKSNQAQEKYFKLRSEHSKKVSDLTDKFREILNNKRDLETLLPSFDKMIERCHETLAQCEKDAEDIRTEWAINLERKLSDKYYSDNICPICGQTLPEEHLRERINDAQKRLNESKAKTKEILRDRAENVKSLRSDTEQQIKDIEAKKAETEKSLKETSEELNKVFAEKQRAEKEKVPMYEELLEDSDYKKLVEEIKTLEEEMMSVSVTSDEDMEKIAELEKQKVEHKINLGSVTEKLSCKSQYEKVQSLIEGINAEEKDLVAQLSELERKEDVARKYQDRQNTILEEKINEHFSLVQWRMFRTVNNGGDPFDEPYCECYVDGVAYHDGLNQAARLNAGLDICNTLSKHYGVSAPIMIDNAEAVNNILNTTGQQIRLYVSEGEHLIIA